ncbi:retrovirus-related pol polyprotein from transposon TNT 1-94 [Tanacetum coccineum]|uniref:Retrovirus-related pol polyprotein from transposon TNT 1-94 n=1 Tax=Tanacetum coccineum TaxID=301880 RepID=A0ABQ4X1A9_9ASTR
MSNSNINLQTQSSNALHNAIMEAGSKERPPMLAPVPVVEGSSETTTERYMENYKNVSQDIHDQLNAEVESVQIILRGIDNNIYSTVDACPNACEMWKAIERLKQGESINMMNELVRNQCHVTNHQVNVQFLLQLQPEWQRFVTLVKQSQELKTVSYHKLYDILKQHQNEVNEIRAKRLARTANPLALRVVNVAGARENVGTPVVKKYGIQCYNYKEYGHVSRECQKPKQVKDAAYHKEKMLLYKQEEAGVQLNAEQANWKDDTDDESDDQELEAHYMYMAQIQKVTPDPFDNSGPIFDDECRNMELVDKLKGEIEDFKTKNKSLESSNNHFKEANNELSKTNQLMFKDLKKFQAELDKYNDVNYASKGCYNDNLALMLAPDSDETIRLEKERRSKLSDLIRPFDYDQLNNLYDLFVPQREKSPEQHYFPKTSKMSHTSSNKEFSKESFRKQTTLLEKRMDESIPWDQKCKSSKELFKIKKSVDTFLPKVDTLKSQLETQKTQFLNEIDRLSREYYYADHMNAILGVYTDLDEVTNLQCDYLETWEKCEHLEKELSKSRTMSKSFEALQKHAINLELDLQQLQTAMDVPINTREPKQNVNQSVATSSKKTVATDSTVKKFRNTTRKIYEQLVEIILFIVDSGCSKHMTGNLKLLTNFVEKFLGTVKFGNDQIAPILGYGDLVQGTITIKRVYYVEGLNHNLFSVGQFCDADLEVAFRKSTCYIRDLKGNDLLTGSRGTDLYSITLQDSTTPNPICLMAKATSSQAWLWHRRLSHLNFNTINLLSKNNIVNGLPKLKFVKDHLCSSCTEFLNKTLHAYFAKEGIRHETSTARTPEQNGVVERRNRTLVEAARTMLSAAKVPLFFWAEAIATACFTQNRSLVIPRHEKTVGKCKSKGQSTAKQKVLEYIAITPVLSTEEPIDSLIMEDEHLDAIPATESDEVIKSSVENLVPTPSEFEGISDDTCDVPICKESSTFDALKDHSEILSDSNDDCTSSDDDSFEDIEYVSLEEVNDVDQEKEEIDLEDILQVQDVILREKLLNIKRLIVNIESLNDNSTPNRVLKSTSPFPIPVKDSDSFLEKSGTFLSYSDNSLPEFESFSDLTEETSSGSTTTHADNSLPEYDSFHFEIEPNQGGLTSVIMETLMMDSDFIIRDFFPYFTYPVVSPLLLSTGSEDTIFDTGIFTFHFPSLKLIRVKYI